MRRKDDARTDDFVRMGLLRSVAQSDWAGVYTITFKDGKIWRIKEYTTRTEALKAAGLSE